MSAWYKDDVPGRGRRRFAFPFLGLWRRSEAGEEAHCWGGRGAARALLLIG